MWSFPLFPERASSHAGDVDALFFAEMGVILFFTALICGLVITFIVRYRKGTKVDRSAPPRSSHLIESLWIGIPLVLSLGMFTWSAIVYHRLYQPPGDAYVVDVVAKQWMFYLPHPEGKGEINELHLPVGKPVQVRMISQDVIHSLFIPAFRVKQDVLPGRYTTLWFTPTKVGEYHLFCAEYCGDNHSRMVGKAYVMEPSDYQAWLSRGGSGLSLAKEGQALFQQKGCGGCHGGGGAVKAPPLDGLYGSQVPILNPGDKEARFVTADHRYLHDSIVLPKKEVVAGYEPVMPTYQGEISEADLLKLIAYLKSIGRAGVQEVTR
jgi:cytochrome c oxidase subunit II